MKSIELVREFSIPRLTLSLTTVVIHFWVFHEISKPPGKDSFKQHKEKQSLFYFSTIYTRLLGQSLICTA